MRYKGLTMIRKEADTMERQDKGLAYLLQYEHVAWFENGMVRILDRRMQLRISLQPELRLQTATVS